MFASSSALVTDADQKRSVGKIIQHPCRLITIQFTNIPGCRYNQTTIIIIPNFVHFKFLAVTIIYITINIITVLIMKIGQEIQKEKIL